LPTERGLEETQERAQAELALLYGEQQLCQAAERREGRAGGVGPPQEDLEGAGTPSLAVRPESDFL